jgi:hypothetical protein
VLVNNAGISPLYPNPEGVSEELYFASDASSFTTGAILAVDGGAQWSLAGGGDQAMKVAGGSVFRGRADGATPR